MNIQHPLILLVLVPIAWLLGRTGRDRLRRMPWLRALVTLVVRLVIAALLIVALSGPSVMQAAAGVNVVFVVDRSAAVGAAGEQAELKWIRDAMQGRGPDDSASIVSVGKQPAWSGPLQGKTIAALPTIDATGTNIDAAVRVALAGLPVNRASRLVLLSDGLQTAGDALAAADRAAALQVPISVIPIGSSPRGDVAVAGADVPRATKKGEHMTLRVSLQADRATNAVIRLSRDGVIQGQRTVALQAGLNTYFFAQVIDTSGTHVFHVEARAPGDPVPQNNALDAVTTTQEASQVLILAGDVQRAAALIHAVESTGLDVSIGLAQQAPESVSALQQYDAVVLADVPASSLAPAAVRAIQAAVHDRGMGLLVAGGPHSYAVGGYAASDLERLLPVNSLVDARSGRADVAMVLIIDESGSMSEQTHGVSKMTMAQRAAIEAISHLQASDSFGVIAFNDATQIVVPFGPVGTSGKQDRAKKAIGQLTAFGNTVIYPALRQAARYLFASKASFKHIVLMTDGQGETTASFLPLIKQMKRNNITLSTIAIGSDAETDELQTWATAGGGRYYFTADPHDIPRFVVLETRISSGPTQVEGTLAVRQAADDPALRSLVGQALPRLHSYNIVAAKDNAQVVLQSQLGDPVLAQWRYGLGMVSAWTGGSSQDWALSWLDQTAFWSDLVHGLLPAALPQSLSPDFQVMGQGLTIGVNSLTPQGDFANLLTSRAGVTDPAGHTTTVPLSQDAPGHYSALVPNPVPGVYRVTVAQYDNTTMVRRTEGAIAVPYQAEYRIGQPDSTLLTAIAGAGNAPTLRTPAEAFSTSGLPRYAIHQDVWPILALLAVLLFPIDVALRVLYSPPVRYRPATTKDSGAATYH